MPAIRRRVPRERRDEFDFDRLTLNDKFAVRHAVVLDGRRTGRVHTHNDLRSAWDANRERLMSQCQPGTRPACWWRFEAPEKRRVVGTRPVLCQPWQVNPFKNWNAGDVIGKEQILESETDFLRRHGLLTAEEEAAIATGANMH